MFSRTLVQVLESIAYITSPHKREIKFKNFTLISVRQVVQLRLYSQARRDVKRAVLGRCPFSLAHKLKFLELDGKKWSEMDKESGINLSTNCRSVTQQASCFNDIDDPLPPVRGHKSSELSVSQRDYKSKKMYGTF